MTYVAKALAWLVTIVLFVVSVPVAGAVMVLSLGIALATSTMDKLAAWLTN